MARTTPVTIKASADTSAARASLAKVTADAAATIAAGLTFLQRHWTTMLPARPENGKDTTVLRRLVKFGIATEHRESERDSGYMPGRRFDPTPLGRAVAKCLEADGD